MTHKNLILDTDSYKLSHFLQYPPGTLNASSYIEARVGGEFPEVLFFGLQAYLLRDLSNVVIAADVKFADRLAKAHGEPFNYEGWMEIAALGFLPLIIEALPEGAVVPLGTPLVQVRASRPGYAWLVSFIETQLLRAVWYPTTVATLSRAIKIEIKAGLEESADTLDKLPFMLHDFGARGVSSFERSQIGGAAHLVNFMGTDTIASIPFLIDNYGASLDDIPAFSLPASEHSTMTSWGRDHEIDAYANMLDVFPTGLVSIVSDSYDLFNAIDNIFGGDLKDKILKRDGVLVVRPDSGVPEEIVPKVLERLWLAFGGVTNTKGYKLLDAHVRVIQGDGINYHSIKGIIDATLRAGYSLENLVFGMGGALLQQPNRDTLRFAMKCNAVQDADGVWQDVYKKPATDITKSSKAGIQSVIYHSLSGEIVTMRRDVYQKAIDESGGNEHWEEGDDLLVPVWQDGNLLRRTTLAEVRERSNYRT
jgi:nicotinamide phosphoribosyltransferase